VGSFVYERSSGRWATAIVLGYVWEQSIGLPMGRQMEGA
jgi:hypothetical protein